MKRFVFLALSLILTVTALVSPSAVKAEDETKRKAEEEKRLAEEEAKRKEEEKAQGFEIEKGKLNKYIGKGGEVVIPRSVIKIGAEAFKGRSDVTSVIIPDTVTSISDLETSFIK